VKVYIIAMSTSSLNYESQIKVFSNCLLTHLPFEDGKVEKQSLLLASVPIFGDSSLTSVLREVNCTRS
jgi:hypothetical protein